MRHSARAPAPRTGTARAGGGVPETCGGEDVSPGASGLQTYSWPSTYGEQAKPRMGFFTDTSVCIGCKACEVACKEWNQIPMSIEGFTGHSYDNSVMLDADRWRHVAFIEQKLTDDPRENGGDLVRAAPVARAMEEGVQ